MTRAPRSASWRVAKGAAIACSSVTTVMPLRGCMSLSLLVLRGDSAQDRGGVHRQPAFVVRGPEVHRFAVGQRLAADVKRVQIESRADRLEAKARHVGLG